MKPLNAGWIILVALVLHNIALYARQGTADSLMQQANAIPTDTAKVSFLIKIIDDNLYKNPKLAVEFGVKAVYLAKQRHPPHIFGRRSTAREKLVFMLAWKGRLQNS